MLVPLVTPVVDSDAILRVGGSKPRVGKKPLAAVATAAMVTA